MAVDPASPPWPNLLPIARWRLGTGGTAAGRCSARVSGRTGVARRNWGLSGLRLPARAELIAEPSGGLNAYSGRRVYERSIRRGETLRQLSVVWDAAWKCHTNNLKGDAM